IRLGCRKLVSYLYRNEVGDPPAHATLDLLTEQLVVSGRLPNNITASLALVKTYSEHVVRGQLDDHFRITGESIAPALSAWQVVAEWAFPETKVPDRWPEIWKGLPAAENPDERLLPGTSYVLTKETGRNAFGPLYAGRDAARGTPVTVNLIPLEQDDTFSGDTVPRQDLDPTTIVAPLHSGTVTVDGKYSFRYLLPRPGCRAGLRRQGRGHAD